MSRVEIVVPTADGDCPATLHVPDGRSAPAVIMYPDAAGVRETFRLMADRLAAAGHVVLLPDVYHRHGAWRPFDRKRNPLDGSVRALFPEPSFFHLR